MNTNQRFQEFRRDSSADRAKAKKYKVIGYDETLFKGVTIEIPLTESCVVCDVAYAEANDFMCPECVKNDYSEEGWNDMRIMVSGNGLCSEKRTVNKDRAAPTIKYKTIFFKIPGNSLKLSLNNLCENELFGSYPDAEIVLHVKY